MLNWIFALMILVGGVFQVISTVRFLKIIKIGQSKSKLTKAFRISGAVLMIALIGGFAGGFVDIWTRRIDVLFIYIPVSSFIIGVFNFIVTYNIYNLNIELSRQKSDLEQAIASTRAKSGFVANMSHEIRTPLNAITGLTMLAIKSSNQPETLEHLKKVDAASKQLLGLINNILDLSKIESNKLELAENPFVLKDALDNISTIISVKAQEKKQNFDFECGAALPAVLIGDEMRFSQIIINLLSNAVKFTPAGGKISLKINSDLQANGRIILTAKVTDSGIGISEGQMRKLFNAYEQAEKDTAQKFGGTGLGLTISKQLAELMGGTIGVESTVGCGSCFTATFLFAAGTIDQIDTESEKEIASHADLSSKCALIVDDIDINREIAAEFLSETGISVEFAENGEIAVSKFSADPDKYDIIFMDVQMPVMDGYKATRAIRSMDIAKGKSVPIIAMTADAFREDILKCEDAGMTSHIAKPIDIKILHQKTIEYLS